MSFITQLGQNKIALQDGLGQALSITHFVLANIPNRPTDEPIDRNELLPAEQYIVASLAVTRHGYVNLNQVIYSLVMDSLVGDFDFNWVGLVDDGGVLIAVSYVPLIQKRKVSGASAGNNITRNFLLAYSGIQAITAITVAAETWQIDFNMRLWGIDERERLSNIDNYGHDYFFGSAWQVVRQGESHYYDVLPGVGYVGGIRIYSPSVQTISIINPADSVFIDVSLQGNISDVSAVVAFVIDSNTHDDYVDGNGFKHFFCKLSFVDNGTRQDVRRIETDSVAMLSNEIELARTEASDALTAAQTVAEESATLYLGIGYLQVADQKPLGTDGGASPANSVTGDERIVTRDLNTIISNSIAGASLVNNRIVLPAGTYRIRAEVYADSVNQHRSALYDVSATTYLLRGSSSQGVDFGASVERVSTHSNIFGRFTITSEHQFEIRHWTQKYQGQGFGQASGVFGYEQYTNVEIIKEK